MDDNPESSSKQKTTEERVTITLYGYPVPTDDIERDQELGAFKEALIAMPGVSINPRDIAITVGHHYVQIGDDCPYCGSSLELRDYTYTDNGAVAEANCSNSPDCGWRGQAIYRLVDLGRYSEGVIGTAVTNGDANPSYVPY